MINIIFQRSHNPKKKYDAVINGSKTISFGSVGYEDYTTTHNDEKKKNYIKRHSNEDWTRTNLESAAWMSRYILWEKPSLREAIANANRMYRDVKFSLN